ncbi:MAG: Unknown protein [uncultured Sulfurovum sp.]|uniref:Uncharacterized protein n=1 Tax=uncultured Sulfurovum sp. TaxID=269237 RepID=A0A6S6SI04_9BACT|nr:MAG: Unknown protein [uncultured Sulfurovum sp.]
MHEHDFVVFVLYGSIILVLIGGFVCHTYRENRIKNPTTEIGKQMKKERKRQVVNVVAIILFPLLFAISIYTYMSA